MGTVTILIMRDPVASVLSVLCSLGVGCVFLLTGLLKLLSPSAFLRHLSKLNVKPMAALPRDVLPQGAMPPGVLPWGVLPWIAGLLAFAECVLGVALIVRMFPDRVFPLCIGVLVVFGAVTAWGASMGRIDNCGCYGNILALTPLQGALLTTLYAALVATAWWLPAGFALMPAVQRDVLIGSVALFAGVAVVSMSSRVKFGKDLLDTSPVKPRRPWNPAWLEGFADYADRRAQLVILMKPACPYCKAWIQPLNKISRRPGMPKVIGGMAADGGRIDSFRKEFSVEFPVLPVKAGTMSRIALAFPTLVTVEDGVIGSVSVNQLPPELVDQLRHSAPGGADLRPGAALAKSEPAPAFEK